MTAFNGLACRLLEGWAVQKQALDLSGSQGAKSFKTTPFAGTKGTAIAPTGAGTLMQQQPKAPVLPKAKTPTTSTPSAADITSPATTGGQSPQYMG